MIHHDDHAPNAGDEIHCAAHTFDQLARDHPVGEVTVLGDFHRAQDRHIDLAAADHRERLVATEIGCPVHRGDGLLARVDQIRVDLVFGREGADAQHAVFRLKRHVYAFGNVVAHQRRDTDAEVHVPAVLQLFCCAFGHLIAIPHILGPSLKPL